jgi:hypothetical protein
VDKGWPLGFADIKTQGLLVSIDEMFDRMTSLEINSYHGTVNIPVRKQKNAGDRFSGTAQTADLPS